MGEGVWPPLRNLCNHKIISRNKRKISNTAKYYVINSGNGSIFKLLNLIDLNLYGWRTSLSLQQLFPIQILLIFLIFRLPPNYIFQCYR